MPWRAQAMKDVASCDKLRLGASTRLPADFRMGKPNPQGLSLAESIGQRSKPGELKHLMYPEERTSTETPLVVASERGRGQWSVFKNRNALEKAAIQGDSPVRVERAQILE
jgi:hypothetical protein